VLEARLAVYREAFQRFIDDFNIYRPFLQSVKVEYESAIDILLDRLRSVSMIHGDFAVKDEDHAIAMRDLRRKHAAEIAKLIDKSKGLLLTISMKEKEIMNIEQRTASVHTKNTKLAQELDESKKSIGILAKALHGLEEDRKVHDIEGLASSAENLSLQMSIQKSHDEIERSVKLLICTWVSRYYVQYFLLY
jgi:hypothetical protein